MKTLFKLLIIPIISFSLFYFHINRIKTKIRLDLQGGVSVILTAPQNTEEELIEQAVEIREQVEAFGDVQEPEISISGEIQYYSVTWCY